jgi:uncharacterized protein
MQGPVQDDEAMEEVLSAVRRTMAGEEAKGSALAPTEPQSFGEDPKATDPGLLSPEATVAIGSAVDLLTATVRKHERTLEDVARETLRPMLKSWLDENLPGVVDRIVQAEIERVIRGR